MKETTEVLFGLFGGLALFIFGMNMMSDCLQRAAGEKMRNILSLLTKNPILGVLAGALTTAVLQSSSATTVMAIGFVSAGFMKLPQAISIIFGANIGTTMTAQIIAFNISDYIYLFIFVGFIISFISKSQKIKNIGQTIFAFGLLFLGIETMGDVMKPLASSPIFINMIKSVSKVPVLGVLVGTVMTIVVQSSSATIAVLQNFAEQPMSDGITSVIGLAGAIPILLGDNIGTTITALLACIGQNKDAKRTAVAHSIFNISGAFLFIWMIQPYSNLIQMISPKGAEIDVISRQIANAHTLFNIIMTLLWVPLIWLMVKIVIFLIPDGNEKFILKETEPRFIDDRLLNQPSVALQLAFKEISRLGDYVKQILHDAKKLDEKLDPILVKSVVDKVGIVHSLNDRINDYFAALFANGVIAEEQAIQATSLMYILGDLDRISTLCKENVDNIVKNTTKKKHYSKEAIKDLRKAMGTIYDMYGDITDFIMHNITLDREKIDKNQEIILQLDEKMRKAHLERVGKGKCDAKLTVSFNQLLHNVDRMGNSCMNLMDASKQLRVEKLFQ